MAYCYLNFAQLVGKPNPYYKHLTDDLLKEAHELGLKVYVWTVDSRSEMVRLMEMGVDGIITNRPDILKSVVGLP